MAHCDSGRSARFDGLWTDSCELEAQHYIAVPDREPIKLCGVHADEIMKAGLISEPNIGKEEFDRREASRDN